MKIAKENSRYPKIAPIPTSWKKDASKDSSQDIREIRDQSNVKDDTQKQCNLVHTNQNCHLVKQVTFSKPHSIQLTSVQAISLTSCESLQRNEIISLELNQRSNLTRLQSTEFTDVHQRERKLENEKKLNKISASNSKAPSSTSTTPAYFRLRIEESACRVRSHRSFCLDRNLMNEHPLASDDDAILFIHVADYLPSAYSSSIFIDGKFHSELRADRRTRCSRSLTLGSHTVQIRDSDFHSDSKVITVPIQRGVVMCLWIREE